MSFGAFVKKHFDRLVAALVFVLLCSCIAALIASFRAGYLPFSSDGDAFDTIYAIEDDESAETE